VLFVYLRVLAMSRVGSTKIVAVCSERLAAEREDVAQPPQTEAVHHAGSCLRATRARRGRRRRSAHGTLRGRLLRIAEVARRGHTPAAILAPHEPQTVDACRCRARDQRTDDRGPIAALEAREAKRRATFAVARMRNMRANG
jgi:hypothetical protein